MKIFNRGKKSLLHYGIQMYIFNKTSYSNNLLLDIPSLYNKVNNFETSNPHDTKFINCLFLKLIVLCKPLLSKVHIHKPY